MDTPSLLARWPWAKAKQDRPHPGVTHWRADDTDGTSLHLFAFDFEKNPRLHFSLYDQDEDDEHPGDDAVNYWTNGLDRGIRHLNNGSRKSVVAAWNGLFFAIDHRTSNPHGIARHVAPVVINGKCLYNVGNHRWAVGAQNSGGRPSFKVMLLPGKSVLEKEFTYAACGAECLIHKGKPLRLQPFPKPGEPIPKALPGGTLEESGYIPIVDHMKTSRTSVAWSRDSSILYLLVVKEPDSEMESALAFRHGQPGMGGWTLADVQRFWISKQVWGAVNLDGGDITQAAWLQSHGSYRAVPPGAANRAPEITISDKTSTPLGSGSIMYFYIWESRP